MKFMRLLLACTLIFTVCSAFTEKRGNDKTIYAYGVAASFNDSVVYYTDIQILDSAVLNRQGFLEYRELYSTQLRYYIESQLGKANYTSMIYFSENKEKLQKKAKKVLGKYQRSKRLVLEKLAESSFKFSKISE